MLHASCHHSSVISFSILSLLFWFADWLVYIPWVEGFESDFFNKLQYNILEFWIVSMMQHMICAIAELESDRQPLSTRYDRKSKDSTLGIMQLLPKTAEWLYRYITYFQLGCNSSRLLCTILLSWCNGIIIESCLQWIALPVVWSWRKSRSSVQAFCERIFRCCLS